jgi:hypothetical protein
MVKQALPSDAGLTGEADKSNALHGLYEQLASIRQPYLDRAYRCSELTIPSLLPRAGHNSTTALPTPYQAIGARGVNNLASKILLSQLPPNQSFFRQVVDKATALKVTKGDPAKIQELEGALQDYEERVMQEIESRSMRAPCHEGFKHEIVCGNVLLHFEDEKKPKVYHLDKYVVQRDSDGLPLTIVVKQCVSPRTIDKMAKEALSRSAQMNSAAQKTVDLYTGIVFNEQGKYDIWQEIAGIEIEGSRGIYSKEECPWLPLRFVIIDGEDYGRSFVDEYLGDLISDDGLVQSVVQAAAIASKLVPMVNPGGMTKMRDAAQARNGQWIYGRKDDISFAQADKLPDLQFCNVVIQRLEERLSQAFLLSSSIQRNAERVTAEEIRYLAGELEEAQGGIYSVLAQEFQLRLVQILIAQMTKKKKLPKLPGDVVKTTIITGLEALSREHDVSKLRVAYKTAVEIYGPEQVAAVSNITAGIERIFTGLQVDHKDLFKSPEQLAQEQQAAQQAAMIQSIAPQAVKGGVDLAKQKNELQGTPFNVNSGSQQPTGQQNR